MYKYFTDKLNKYDEYHLIDCIDYTENNRFISITLYNIGFKEIQFFNICEQIHEEVKEKFKNCKVELKKFIYRDDEGYLQQESTIEIW